MNVRELADARHELHIGQASHRPLSPDYELIGLRGEEVFGYATGLDLDLEERPGGDYGRDFVVPATDEHRAWTMDVKTARLPYNLIVERGKVRADAYVLAGYREPGWIAFLGWEPGRVMREQPVRDFGYGVMNHYKHATHLRPMRELYDLIDR